MDGQKTPFVRELGSSGKKILCPVSCNSNADQFLFYSDRKVRDKALDSLTTFVRSRTDLTLVDLLKLWKGLFFCMQDRYTLWQQLQQI